MTFKLFRRGSARCVGLLSAFVTVVLCLYYISMGQTGNPVPAEETTRLATISESSFNVGGRIASQYFSNKYQETQFNNVPQHEKLEQQQHQQHEFVINPINNKVFPLDTIVNVVNENWLDKCYTLFEYETNITAIHEYAKFDFQPEWIRTKEYWDRAFEDRFESQKKDKHRLPLKIFVVPHSHNDPGWLKTFANYFQSDSRQILNLIVTKMQEYTDMTFIWSEISFLQVWWDQAHPTKQRALKHLINSGRFEITTGGWVMTDEANVHIYPMLDQLIEGHQWLRNNLNVTPKVGWSIDPFGHGSTVPYLLSNINFDGTIIQRIHYAWKQWFARQQNGDFIWTPYWQLKDTPNKEHGHLLTHNMPFDIYSIKGSCGPHPFICLNFDFRKIPGEYTEYSIKAQFITDDNIQEKAELLLEQYERTASLFPHNVALIPVGDDFRYNREREVDQQYINYKKLIDYIMTNKHIYNVDISFGTPSDYFTEIRKRSTSFPSFKGDFFVYSDIFSEGRPAYWSGFFTTRPFYKLLCTDLEHNLRAAEILFTFAYNTARQYKHENAIKVFEKNYEKMILARRNLGLFQHHDAITGTSKAAVMRDYGMRLFESIQDVVKMQESTIELLLQNDSVQHKFLLSEFERDNFNKLPRKIPLQLISSPITESIAEVIETKTPKSATFVVYNSLAQKRVEIITLRTEQPNVKIINELGEELRHIQINPVWNITDNYGLGMSGTYGNTGRIRISTHIYEVMFVAKLSALSLTTFRLELDETNYKRNLASIYCDDCTDMTISQSIDRISEFELKSKPPGDIQLENNYMRLLIDEKTGFLRTVTRKNINQKLMRPMQCAIKFAAYRSAQFHSGAYLFKTDPEQSEAENDVLNQYVDIRVIITSGPISSDVTVIYGPFLRHTVRIFNTRTHLDAAIYIENDIDFEPPPKNRETELFMRFVTDIDNITPSTVQQDILKETTTISELPIFYSDQNGFQFHKRIKVPAIGIEGNYFPITTAAFIQDKDVRLSLLTTHSQGAASYEPGQLEVMLDRRTLYDDYRGMGEGVVDSRLTRHKFWLLIEDIAMESYASNVYQVLSLQAQQLANGLRYPVNLYFIESLDKLNTGLSRIVHLLPHGSLPCDIHLTTFRTLSEEQLQLFPSTSALLILHRQGFDCRVSTQVLNHDEICVSKSRGLEHVQLGDLSVQSIESTSLTGTLDTKERKRLKSFADIAISPMDLVTFNITFKV